MKNVLVFGAAIKLSMDKQTGIMKKVLAQAHTFEADFDVYTWGFSDNNIIYIHEDKVTIVDRFENKMERRTKYYTALVNFVIERNASAVYIRYSTTDFYLLKMLRAFKNNNILSVLEIPSYPYKGEYMKGIKNRAIYGLDVLLRGQLKKYVSKIVIFVGKPSKVHGISCINTMNGIDTSGIVTINSIPSQTLNLIAVASMLPHHGFDRMIEGLHKYYSYGNEQSIIFHVVGDGPELDRYKELVDKYGLQTCVYFYGQKTGKKLDELFEIADIAVGSLGLHRIGLKEGSTLKNKEYAVRGLPIVYATYESFLNNSEYALRLSDDDSYVDIEEVVKFWKKMKNIDNLHEKIHLDAVSKCDMKTTMLPVCEYFKANIMKNN